MTALRDEYQRLADLLYAGDRDIESVKSALKRHRVETPSWGYGDSGTRFQVFHFRGAARDIREKLQDAAQVHQYTGICPSVAIHIPWDRADDYANLAAYARSLRLEIGAVNPNLFQDQEYKLGSLCHPQSEVRAKAVAHILECIEIAQKADSSIISLWVADGTNYPGQDSLRGRKHRLGETLAEVYGALAAQMRLLIEYKFFEPGFYHTDIADWGMAYALARNLGPQAQVLIDLGHHPLGTNIEHLVAFLIDEGKLGGFHFNSKKYADDDLTSGSVNPYELFLIFSELIDGARDPQTRMDVAYMIDQSHNVKPKIEAAIQSVVNLQTAYAKALLVDRRRLAEAQRGGDIVGAEETLQAAFQTDVRPLLAVVRQEMGVPEDPLSAFRASGYQERIAEERG
jgi:L-rhamnose isomerase/sugar isomerase